MLDIIGIILFVLLFGPNELRITVLKILGCIALFLFFAYLFVEYPVIFGILCAVSLIFTFRDLRR